MQTTDDCKGVYHEVGSFTPYALNSDIWVMYIFDLILTGHLVLESSHACHLRYALVFQGDLPSPFRACS